MTDSSDSGIVDWHTHVWLPEHLGKEWGPELDSKSRSGTGPSTHGSYEHHVQAMADGNVSAALVVGLTSQHLGMHIPNDYIAEFVNSDPTHRVGLASVDPNDRGAVVELRRAARLGLKGLKLSPPYQDFHPHSEEASAVYSCAADLGMFLMFHQGAVFSRRGVMEVAYPMLLDKVAREFPETYIIIAHAGQPWSFETVALMYKHANVFTDISARLSRPTQLYGILSNAIDYGVESKVLFGSDFPAFSPSVCVEQLININERAGASEKPIPDALIQGLLHERPLSLLGLA